MSCCPHRKAALEAGERFYFNGKPCHKGHLSKRYTCSHRCFECAMESMQEQRDVAKRLRILNPKPLTPRQAAINAGATTYNTGEPCSRGHYSNRCTANGACIECARITTQVREIDNDEIKDKRRKYRRKNQERYRTHHRNRIAKQRELDGSHSIDDINQMWDNQLGRCIYCKDRLAFGYHVDHIIPISRGGTNFPSNLQLLCQPCNTRKHTKTHDEFLEVLSKAIRIT